MTPDVFGKNGEIFVNNHEKRWALDFEPWKDWLGMEIDEITKKTFSDSDIIALCLSEMFFSVTTTQKNKRNIMNG